MIIPLGLMTAAPGVEPWGGNPCVPKGPIVQLIQAKRVPSRSATFAKARMPEASLTDSPVVFEPDHTG